MLEAAWLNASEPRETPGSGRCRGGCYLQSVRRIQFPRFFESPSDVDPVKPIIHPEVRLSPTFKHNFVSKLSQNRRSMNSPKTSLKYIPPLPFTLVCGAMSETIDPRRFPQIVISFLSFLFPGEDGDQGDHPSSWQFANIITAHPSHRQSEFRENNSKQKRANANERDRRGEKDGTLLTPVMDVLRDLLRASTCKSSRTCASPCVCGWTTLAFASTAPSSERGRRKFKVVRTQHRSRKTRCPACLRRRLVLLPRCRLPNLQLPTFPPYDIAGA